MTTADGAPPETVSTGPAAVVAWTATPTDGPPASDPTPSPCAPPGGRFRACQECHQSCMRETLGIYQFLYLFSQACSDFAMWGASCPAIDGAAAFLVSSNGRVPFAQKRNNGHSQIISFYGPTSDSGVLTPGVDNPCASTVLSKSTPCTHNGTTRE